MYWKVLWAWLRTWQGAIPAVLTVSAAIYYGPKKMLETWDWYLNRFRDEAVLDVLRTRRFAPRPNLYAAYLTQSGHLGNPEHPEQREIPYYPGEVAKILNRKEESVEKSLVRLRRRGRVECMEMLGWTFKN
jgi:hypothetical protein